MAERVKADCGATLVGYLYVAVLRKHSHVFNVGGPHWFHDERQCTGVASMSNCRTSSRYSSRSTAAACSASFRISAPCCGIRGSGLDLQVPARSPTPVFRPGL